MRVIAAFLFSSAVVLAPALAAAQATTMQATTAQPAQTATAPTTQVAQAQAAPAATSDSSGVNLDEIVCRNTAPPTGSRLGGGRECHTVREWNLREKEAQDTTRRQEGEGLATKSSGSAR